MTVAPVIERAELCRRVREASAAVPAEDWTMEELRALVTVLEAVVAARQEADKIGKYLPLPSTTRITTASGAVRSRRQPARVALRRAMSRQPAPPAMGQTARKSLGLPPRQTR